ncbi:uncharacterized protein LOC8260280 [Ricinus communis]|uniref:WW domain-containing protein n=1 Tax=Ricinus communis TaxID=3988 RepID=B9SYF5_RICCO|nr:uncharacterized protein LOC8260280 [Ricinus communis]EEF31362.1 conserved hypothetical protein [Ricinus communis]|eukprot:XP_002531024.1 uncharacterized protein LOC8260280 [Ricinus communis]
MELTELSLAPTTTTATTATTTKTQFIVEKLSSTSSESECNHSSRKKRKFLSDHHLLRTATTTGPPIQASFDLHVKDPLPLDWEQCLDLESGRMYYLNRKTLRKSWNWPKDQKLDLELNISPLTDCTPDHHQQCNNNGSNSVLLEDSRNNFSSPSSNMVALACLNCHLLVILSRSSPSCPNCKYVHSLPITHQVLLPKISPTKSLNTLSLLN